jgi:mono/diheme cytochrome c family protein
MLKMRDLLVVMVVLLAGCAAGGSESMPAEQVIPATTVTAAATPSVTVVAESAAERGRLLFHEFVPEVGFACATCHYSTSDQRLIGPGLAGVGQRVQSYKLNVAAPDYLREAITMPDAFVAYADPAYPAGVMPDTYGDILTNDQIDDLIAFLLSLPPAQ